MNSAHLHLLLNHFPTIGSVAGLGLLLLSLVRRNDHLRRASLEVLFLTALISLPAYLSGNTAQFAVAGREDYSEALIRAHQDAALVATLSMLIAGALAWFGLWRIRRGSQPPAWTVPVVLAAAVVTVVLMGRTATIGGEIRHEEIRVAGAEAPALEGEEAGGGGWLTSGAVASFVTNYAWVWPASETVHFIGLGFLAAVILPLNLRMLGLMKNVPYAALHRLLPWAILGFAVNTVTGFLFFIAAADQYTQNPAFYWKIGLLMLAGGNLLYLTAFDQEGTVTAGREAPMLAKLVAASGLFVWFGVIFWGRLMPFLGLSF